MICIIKGPYEATVQIGMSLRTCYIASGRGALLVRETEQGALPQLMEKIIFKENWPEKPEIDKITWKRDPVIVLLGSMSHKLVEFEKACPGFTEKFGPLYVLDIEEPLNFANQIVALEETNG